MSGRPEMTFCENCGEPVLDGGSRCLRCLPNIHDYLDQIGAKPPPVKGLVVIPVVETIEEAVDLLDKDL